MEKEDKKEEGKGFVVKDRRFSSPKEKEEESKPDKEKREETGEGKPKGEKPKSEGAPREEIPIPQIDFANFTHSLYISALIQLGEIADPATKQPLKDLVLAKQTIDLLGMLREKTKGNLLPEEEKIVSGILQELKLNYVDELAKNPSPPETQKASQ